MTDGPLGAWFDRALEAAWAASPASVDVVAGAWPVRVRGVDPATVEPVAEALCGAVPPGSAPVPTIEVVMADDGNLPAPLPPALLPEPDEARRVLVRDEGRWALAGGDGGVWMLDGRSGRALRWWRRPGPPDWERVAPVRHVLSWWAAAQGGALVHAAAVATDDGAGLLVGPGGSGKSTTALACLGSAVRVLGDDYVAVAPDGAGRLHVIPVYRRAKVDDAGLARAGLPRDRVVGAAAGKRVVRLQGEDDAVGTWPVVAVDATTVVPAGPPHLRPASRAATLRRLAPSTLAQSPGGEAPTWAVLAAIVRQAQVGELAVGPDLGSVPDVLAGRLAGADQRAVGAAPVPP